MYERRQNLKGEKFNMKTMKKLVALFAAATVAMSMSVSAFAAVISPTISEDKTTLSFLVGTDDADISISDEEQITLLAYLIPETDSNGTAYTAETIPAYVNQEVIALGQVGGSEGFGEVPVDVEKLDEGYAIAVMLGGSDGTVAQGIIIYNEANETIEFVWGDINNDGTFSSEDISMLKMYSIGGTKTFGSYTIGEKVTNTDIVWGDINNDGTFSSEDISMLSMYSVGGSKTFGTYTIGETAVVELNN